MLLGHWPGYVRVRVSILISRVWLALIRLKLIRLKLGNSFWFDLERHLAGAVSVANPQNGLR